MALPNIINEINTIKSTYLPKSGGVMTGTIYTPGYGCVTSENSTTQKSLALLGCSTKNESCASINLKSIEDPDEPGLFYINAKDDTYGNKSLVGRPNGVLTWNGNNVITSAGGTITGNLIVSSIQFSNKGLFQSSNDAQYKSFTITSENTWSNEVPFIVMRKIDATNSDKGSIYINAGNGTTYSRITLNADSSLNHDGRPIVSVTKWTSGASGYRKYADGFIEQWGKVSLPSQDATVSVAFPIAFSNTNYSITTGTYSTQHAAYFGYLYQTAPTTTGFKCHLYGYSGSTQMYWHACGY